MHFHQSTNTIQFIKKAENIPIPKFITIAKIKGKINNICKTIYRFLNIDQLKRGNVAFRNTNANFLYIQSMFVDNLLEICVYLYPIYML